MRYLTKTTYIKKLSIGPVTLEITESTSRELLLRTLSCVKEVFPHQSSLFLFCGRRKDRIKGVLWDKTASMLLC